MFFASQRHELKHQSTTLALPTRLSCAISSRLSIKTFVARKFYISNINRAKNWFHVFRLKSVSIKSKFRWQSSQNPNALQLGTTQWHLSNPTTISTSLPKKLRGTYGWVHHSELNNASSEAVAVLGQNSETGLSLICQKTPFLQEYILTPAFRFCLERWSNTSQMKKYLGKSSMRAKSWDVQHRKQKQDIRGSLGITALWIRSPSPAFHWARMPLLPHTPVTSHKTQEMAQTQRHKTAKDQMIS